MYKFYYLLKNMFRRLVRNKRSMLTNILFPFFCFFILTSFMRLTFILRHLEKAVASGEVAKSSPLHDLLTDLYDGFISFIILGCGVICITLLFFGLFYLFISIQRNFLLEKSDRHIKKLLGSSTKMVTSEFFLAQGLIIFLFAGMGTFVSNRFYQHILSSAAWWLKKYLPTAHALQSGIDLPILGILMLMLVCHFFFLLYQENKTV